ncbi:MAG: sigma 54-interacting transcriptional regulator [Vicinamibacteria bacterium]
MLQEREFERVGDNRTIKVDVRIVAATNSDLARMVQEGTFREDLYYRLNVIAVQVPALRERKDDVPLLVQHFIEKLCGEGPRPTVSQEAMRHLMGYAWPGNVRQLENAVERAVALVGARGEIDVAVLPPEVQAVPVAVAPSVDFPEEGVNLPALVAGIERDLIARALARTSDNKADAARLLGLKRTTLVEKLRRIGA